MKIDFDLYFITDRKKTFEGRSLIETVRMALEGGVRAVQLREKDLSTAELLPLATELRQMTADFGAKLLINGDMDVALAVEADGVHLGGGASSVEEARKLLGEKKLIGVSTHSPEEIRAANKKGVDFLCFSPIFHTPSKAAYGPPQGIEKLKHACETSDIPVFALGGIGPNEVPEAMNAGAAGVALISAIGSSPDPATAARHLIRGLKTNPI